MECTVSYCTPNRFEICYVSNRMQQARYASKTYIYIMNISHTGEFEIQVYGKGLTWYHKEILMPLYLSGYSEPINKYIACCASLKEISQSWKRTLKYEPFKHFIIGQTQECLSVKRTTKAAWGQGSNITQVSIRPALCSPARRGCLEVEHS